MGEAQPRSGKRTPRGARPPIIEPRSGDRNAVKSQILFCRRYAALSFWFAFPWVSLRSTHGYAPTRLQRLFLQLTTLMGNRAYQKKQPLAVISMATAISMDWFTATTLPTAAAGRLRGGSGLAAFRFCV